MIYSPSRFVFLHIPRTGGLSAALAIASRIAQVGLSDVTINLSGIGDGPWWRHSLAREIAPAIPHWDDLWRFAFMRNPWEIVESFWRLTQRDYRTFCQTPPRQPASSVEYWRYAQQTADMPFGDWVRWHFKYLHGSGGFWNYFCCGPGGEHLGVEALRFERLQEEWRIVCDRLQLGDLPLPKINAAPVQRPVWDRETIDFIGRLCRSDIERFAYAPPSSPNS